MDNGFVKLPMKTRFCDLKVNSSHYEVSDFQDSFILIPRDKQKEFNLKNSIPCLLFKCECSSNIIFYLHSFSEDLGHVAFLCHSISKLLNVSMLIMEFPGFGCSKTPPNEVSWSRFMNDAYICLKFIVRRLRFSVENIFISSHGTSAGVALHLALWLKRLCPHSPDELNSRNPKPGGLILFDAQCFVEPSLNDYKMALGYVAAFDDLGASSHYSSNDSHEESVSFRDRMTSNTSSDTPLYAETADFSRETEVILSNSQTIPSIEVFKETIPPSDEQLMPEIFAKKTINKTERTENCSSGVESHSMTLQDCYLGGTPNMSCFDTDKFDSFSNDLEEPKLKENTGSVWDIFLHNTLKSDGHILAAQNTTEGIMSTGADTSLGESFLSEFIPVGNFDRFKLGKVKVHSEYNDEYFADLIEKINDIQMVCVPSFLYSHQIFDLACKANFSMLILHNEANSLLGSVSQKLFRSSLSHHKGLETYSFLDEECVKIAEKFFSFKCYLTNQRSRSVASLIPHSFYCASGLTKTLVQGSIQSKTKLRDGIVQTDDIDYLDAMKEVDFLEGDIEVAGKYPSSETFALSCDNRHSLSVRTSSLNRCPYNAETPDALWDIHSSYSIDSARNYLEHFLSKACLDIRRITEFFQPDESIERYSPRWEISGSLEKLMAEIADLSIQPKVQDTEGVNISVNFFFHDGGIYLQKNSGYFLMVMYPLPYCSSKALPLYSSNWKESPRNYPVQKQLINILSLEPKTLDSIAWFYHPLTYIIIPALSISILEQLQNACSVYISKPDGSKHRSFFRYRNYGPSFKPRVKIIHDNNMSSTSSGGACNAMPKRNSFNGSDGLKNFAQRFIHSIRLFICSAQCIGGRETANKLTVFSDLKRQSMKGSLPRYEAPSDLTLHNKAPRLIENGTEEPAANYGCAAAYDRASFLSPFFTRMVDWFNLPYNYHKKSFQINGLRDLSNSFISAAKHGLTDLPQTCYSKKVALNFDEVVKSLFVFPWGTTNNGPTLHVCNSAATEKSDKFLRTSPSLPIGMTSGASCCESSYDTLVSDSKPSILWQGCSISGGHNTSGLKIYVCDGQEVAREVASFFGTTKDTADVCAYRLGSSDSHDNVKTCSSKVRENKEMPLFDSCKEEFTYWPPADLNASLLENLVEIVESVLIRSYRLLGVKF